MPQTRWNKGRTIVNSDAYNLAGDLATDLDTYNLPVPVASQAERDALVPPGGKYAGMLVCRTDLAGCPIERYDGTTWWGDSTQALTLNTANFNAPPTGYGPLTLAISAGGRVATLSGNVVWANGSGGNNVATIPTGYRPGYETGFTSVSQANSTGALGTIYRGVVTTGGSVNLNWMSGGVARSTDNVIPVLATWLIAQ
jgi:hypothetical protein